MPNSPLNSREKNPQPNAEGSEFTRHDCIAYSKLKASLPPHNPAGSFPDGRSIESRNLVTKIPSTMGSGHGAEEEV